MQRYLATIIILSLLIFTNCTQNEMSEEDKQKLAEENVKIDMLKTLKNDSTYELVGFGKLEALDLKRDFADSLLYLKVDAIKYKYDHAKMLSEMNGLINRHNRMITDAENNSYKYTLKHIFRLKNEKGEIEFHELIFILNSKLEVAETE